MKSKKFLNSLLCGFLIAGMGTINAMEDAQERHIIASALKPTWYSKYWPVTVAAHAVGGFACYSYPKHGLISGLVTVIPPLVAPLIVYSSKLHTINVAITNATNDNNLLLAQRLKSFKLKNAMFGYTNVICLFLFGIMKQVPTPMLWASSLAANLLVEQWATKEESIPE